jgi:DNA-binding transcriptional ArsR family regulator
MSSTRSASRLNPQAMRAGAGQAVAALKALGNEDRLLLLCQLAQGEMCVSDLEAALDIRQPTLSQQLAVLRAEGLVETRREGKHIYYQVADVRMLDMLHLLHRLYCKEGVRR